MDALCIAAVLRQPVRAVGAVCAITPSCPAGMGPGICVAAALAKPTPMMRFAGVAGGGALPSGRVIGIAGDNVAGEAARAGIASAPIRQRLRVLVIVPGRLATMRAGQNVSIERAFLGAPAPGMSNRPTVVPVIAAIMLVAVIAAVIVAVAIAMILPMMIATIVAIAIAAVVLAVIAVIVAIAVAAVVLAVIAVIVAMTVAVVVPVMIAIVAIAIVPVVIAVVMVIVAITVIVIVMMTVVVMVVGSRGWWR